MFNVDHLSNCLINMFNSFDGPYTESEQAANTNRGPAGTAGQQFWTHQSWTHALSRQILRYLDPGWYTKVPANREPAN